MMVKGLSYNDGESKNNLKEKATFLEVIIQIRWHMNILANLKVLYTQYKSVQRCYWTPVRLNGSGFMNHSCGRNVKMMMVLSIV